MTRTNLASLLLLIVGVPAAAAATFFNTGTAQPCFVAGSGAYRMTAGAHANVTVRIDNKAAAPNLRMQLVDDPAAADFVLVDDGTGTCAATAAVTTIRLDPAASAPDLLVALSQEPAPYKIYVRSAHFSQQDAAALFAVIWKTARQAGLTGREFAARP
jgi:hypothetical protein